MHEKGFTLVELAIALVVIGLLIGGVLKGQELIQQAKVTQTIRQVESYKTALTAFQSTYDAWPGDMLDPGTRIPGCNTSPCNISGNGNRLFDPPRCCIEYYSVAAQRAFMNGGDARNFWRHMQVAGLINTVSDGAPQDLPGGFFPAAPWENTVYVHAHYWNTGCTPAHGCFASNGIGIQPLTQNATTRAAIPVRAAASIDRKIDDGKPFYQGDVMMYEDWRVGFTATSLGCATVRDYPAVYNETNGNGSCNLFFAFRE